MSENLNQNVTSNVNISDDAIAAIAALAATDVEGVASMAGNLTNALIARLGIRNLSKGVKICLGKTCVSIELSLNLEYGCCIPDVCRTVREKVKSQVENMTGLEVTDVSILVSSISMENN